MKGDRIVVTASVAGSLTGTVTPYLIVMWTRWGSWYEGNPFELGLLFGGPLVGALCGGVVGANLGRSLPTGAGRADRRRAVLRATMVGFCSAVAGAALAGIVAGSVLRIVDF